MNRNKLFFEQNSEIIEVVINVFLLYCIYTKIKIAQNENKQKVEGYINITPLFTKSIKYIPFIGTVLFYLIYILSFLISDLRQDSNYILTLVILYLMLSISYIKESDVSIHQNDIIINRKKVYRDDIEAIKYINSKSKWNKYEIITGDKVLTILLNKQGEKVFLEYYNQFLQTSNS